jgi:hypothetical protein
MGYSSSQMDSQLRADTRMSLDAIRSVANHLVEVAQKIRNQQVAGVVIQKQTAEAEQLAKPSDSPVVSIFSWGAIGSGSTDSLPHGFYLTNSGDKPAYEVAIHKFRIDSQTVAASNSWAEIRGGNTGNGQIQVWLESRREGTDRAPGKWNLLEAFDRASVERDGAGHPYGRPSFSIAVRVFYRDFRDLWYESTQDVTFVPATGHFHFEFGAVKHRYLGSNRPDIESWENASATTT